MNSSLSVSFSVYDTGIRVHNNKTNMAEGIRQSLFSLLTERGFQIGPDPEIEKHYSCLSEDYWYGKKKELEFKSHRYPTGFEIKFYQNVNFENRHGGEHDFDKFEKMPYLIKKQFLLELRYIKELFLGEGCIEKSDPILKTAWEKVNYHITSSCHYEGRDTEKQPDYNATDKDGKRIHDNEIKYFRDHKGRLMRGTVIHNINNMWWVVVNKYCYRNLSSFSLFDADTEGNRLKKYIKPSGWHNPKSRQVYSESDIKQWEKEAKKIGKAGRMKKANEFLMYLYSINWTSRCFQFIRKANDRLGLVEPEGAPYFIGQRLPRKVFDPPRALSLYPPNQMSSTESSWVKGLREYVVYGRGSINSWFCRDDNGEGGSAYLWPEVKDKLITIGALFMTPELKQKMII